MKIISGSGNKRVELTTTQARSILMSKIRRMAKDAEVTEKRRAKKYEISPIYTVGEERKPK